MGFKREEVSRASAEGYYLTYSSDATDVLDYISGNINGVEEERPSYYGRDGRVFRVTIVVEEI